MVGTAQAGFAGGGGGGRESDDSEELQSRSLTISHSVSLFPQLYAAKCIIVKIGLIIHDCSAVTKPTVLSNYN